jgi:tRNA-(ms[2]io[6]A)-hydroxylase
MLHLAGPTHPSWLPRALHAMDRILVDHAHCEKKAAGVALNLLFCYPDKLEMMAPLSALAREELRHFELVLGELERRGIPFGRIEPSPYAGRLLAAVRKDEPHRLLDTLLCCSLIEARSCERMKILAENLEDEGLARLYRSLLASEARHHGSYLELAALETGQDELMARLDTLAAHEAAILATPAPASEPVRMHSA